jgi:hypothetical protein
MQQTTTICIWTHTFTPLAFTFSVHTSSTGYIRPQAHPGPTIEPWTTRMTTNTHAIDFGGRSVRTDTQRNLGRAHARNQAQPRHDDVSIASSVPRTSTTGDAVGRVWQTAALATFRCCRRRRSSTHNHACMHTCPVFLPEYITHTHTTHARRRDTCRGTPIQVFPTNSHALRGTSAARATVYARSHGRSELVREHCAVLTNAQT